MLYSASIVISVHSPYYEVTVGPNTNNLEDIVGVYNKTEYTVAVHTWTSYVYMKTDPEMYLLQQNTGGWVIADDKFGKEIRVKQAGNYQKFPDKDIPACPWTTKWGSAYSSLKGILSPQTILMYIIPKKSNLNSRSTLVLLP